MNVVSAADAPDGGSFAFFENRSPSRTAEASQAFGLDGRRFRALLLSGVVKGDDIKRGPGKRERASTVLAFYNAKRELIDAVAAGDWVGTFDWRSFEQRVMVPSATREAIVRVGLCGATGRLSVDGLRLTAFERIPTGPAPAGPWSLDIFRWTRKSRSLKPGGRGTNPPPRPHALGR
jgi:hypothetical protein